MFYQVFLSPKVKRRAIISNKRLLEQLGTTASVTSMFKYEREIYHFISVKLRLII